MTAAVSNSPLSADVNGILNPKKDPGREVSADISGGNVNSQVKSAGDGKIFEAAGKKLGKQDFLTLLVTQLKFQDPLQPTENTEFVAQLAQFSNLEGTQNINTAIEDLGKKITDMVGSQSASATTMSNSSATGLIGKIVRVNAKDIAYVSGQSGAVKISVHTDAGADPVLSILDQDGAIVNVMPLKGGADSQISWNGSRMDGTKAPTGNYAIKVTTRDGTADAGYAYFENKVEGITFAKDGVRLEISGQKIGMDQVVRVGEAPSGG